MRRFCFLVVCVLSLFCVLSSSGCGSFDYEDVKIKRVIDGDTVELMDGRMARYIGIDCPELKRKTPSGWVDVYEPFGEEARRANQEFLSRGRVSFKFDVDKTDKYGRLLVYCFVAVNGEEKFVQEELLRNGLAYLYTFVPNVNCVDRLVAALGEAKDQRRGVWSVDLDIDAREASNFIGHRKLVRGDVKRAITTDKTVRLIMDGLLVVIFRKDLGVFVNEGIEPVDFYKNQRIRVFGLIKEYQGQTEIIVSHPSEIEIL